MCIVPALTHLFVETPLITAGTCLETTIFHRRFGQLAEMIVLRRLPTWTVPLRPVEACRAAPPRA